jgi:hypothetical protein
MAMLAHPATQNSNGSRWFSRRRKARLIHNKNTV